MSRIDPDFPYDVFRFIVESRRSGLLETWLGKSDAIEGEKSVQGLFEAIQARILRLPELLDPASVLAQLRELAWQVGWDDTPEVAFIDGLATEDLRKLIRLSVPLWKQKGTAAGVINAIRVFTGKTAVLQDWFFHRWIVDETGEWVESRGADPYLVGDLYTEGDESVTWVLVNREGLTSVERRYVFDLLTFVHASGEHFVVVYAAFVDDFRTGFAQWAQIGTPGTLVATDGDPRGGLLEGAAVVTNVTAEELATWGPDQRTIVHVEFAGVTADEELRLEVMRDASGAAYYEARLTAAGTLELLLSGVLDSTAALVLPAAGTPVALEVRVEPVSAAETKVGVYVGGEVQLETTFLGVDALVDPSSGVVVRREGIEAGATYIDNVVILATPYDTQFIGQKAITPTSGLGGLVYIADPDPGLEEFAG